MSRAGVGLASLSLFPATPEQLAEARKRHFTEWAQHLTWEQFNGLNDIYDGGEQPTGGKWVPWVLAPRDNPKTLDFMCACETYRRVAVVKRPSANSDDGVEEVPAFGVACVFTPKDKRHKGYASHMMRLLHWLLASDSLKPADFPSAWGTPPPKVPGVGDAKFSVLYSDAGAEFYLMSGLTQEKDGGWEVKGNVSTLWEVTNGDRKDEGGDAAIGLTPEEISLVRQLLQAQPQNSVTLGLMNKLLRWKDLREAKDLEALWAKDAQHLKNSVASGLPKAGTAAIVSFLPTQGIAMYQVPRSKWHTAHMYTLDVWGTELQDEPIQEPTYATWAVDTAYKPPRFLVTRIRASSEKFPLLINRILQIAKKAGLQKVEIWNLDESLVDAAASLGGRTYERTEHLPALRWYGEEQTRDIQWVFNEKFAWC